MYELTNHSKCILSRPLC